MRSKCPLIAAAVSAALLSAAAEPSSEANDSCLSSRGETVCPPPSLPRSDIREDGAERPPVERTRAEQAPPPPVMPPGRGMTYAMESPAPYYHHPTWIASSNGIFRNAVLLDSSR